MVTQKVNWAGVVFWLAVAMVFIMVISMSSCTWPDPDVFVDPDAPVDTITIPVDTTVIDTIAVDTIPVDTIPQDTIVPCACDPNDLHLVVDPPFLQGWFQFDAPPDSIFWRVFGTSWSTGPNPFDWGLVDTLKSKFPQYTWTVYFDEDEVAIFCDGTIDKDFIFLNVSARPYNNGHAGTKYYMTFNRYAMYVGGALTFEEFRDALIARPSVRSMNVRAGGFTLEQNMVLWELILQYCECRVASPGAAIPYRVDFRWGEYDPEIIGRFQERKWMPILPAMGPVNKA